MRSLVTKSPEVMMTRAWVNLRQSDAVWGCANGKHCIKFSPCVLSCGYGGLVVVVVVVVVVMAVAVVVVVTSAVDVAVVAGGSWSGGGRGDGDGDGDSDHSDLTDNG